MRPALKIFFAYIALTYGVQALSDAFLDLENAATYRGFDQFRVSLWMVPLFCGLVLAFWRKLPSVKLPDISGAKRILEARAIQYPLIAVGLFLSYRFFTELGSGFRHSGRLLSEVGVWVSVLLIVRVYIVGVLLHRLFGILNQTRTQSRPDRLTAFLFFVILGLSVSGSLDIPLIFFALLLVLPDRLIRPLLLRTADVSASAARARLGRSALKLSVVAAIAGLALFLGRSNKIGVQKTAEIFLNPAQLINYLRYVAMRTSSSYGSLQSIGSNHLFDFDLQLKAWATPFRSLFYRLGILGGMGIPRPSVTSIARLNFMTTYLPFHPRAGSSPGLLAASLLLPVFPLNVIVATFLTALLLRFLDRSLPKERTRLTVFAILALLYFIYPFYESPQDFFILIDPNSGYLAFTFFVIWVNTRQADPRTEAVDA